MLEGSEHVILRRMTPRAALLSLALFAIAIAACTVSCSADDAGALSDSNDDRLDDPGVAIAEGGAPSESGESDASTAFDASDIPDASTDASTPVDAGAPSPPKADACGAFTERSVKADNRGWTRPLAGYRISQPFKGANVHNGTDLAKAYGSIVYAAHAGTVTEIIKAVCKPGFNCVGTGSNWAYDPVYFMSGDKIVVTHPDGIKTVYDHVGPAGRSKVGMKVCPDTPIGEINATGNRTGAHLHFAVIVNKRPVEPESYVDL